MRNAEVIRQARRWLGCKEDPPRSNDGACVNAIQTSTGAFNLPWCASYVFKVWQDAEVVAKSEWATASTYYMVEGARSRGWLTKEPVEGSAVVWSPGVSGHTEIFVHWVNKAAGQAKTIGGNTSDQVKEHVRNVSGAYFVTPPILLKSEVTYYYWWEDPKAQPIRHGLYAKEEYRENAIAAWVKKHGNPGHVRRGKLTIKDPRTGEKVTRYTFWTGQSRRSPDYESKAKRDRSKRDAESARGRRLRSRSRKAKL